MKINWKLRLRNKTTLTALVASAISLAYIVLGIFDIVPGVTQSQLTDLAAADTLLRGDTPEAPDFLPLLYFALSTLGFVFPALTDSLRTWALTLFFTGNATPHAEGLQEE